MDGYAAYRAEVKQTEIEETVNKRISSLTQNIVLSSEQKDAVFQIFSAAESGFDPIKLMSEGLVPEEVRQQIDDDTQNKLSGIMTQAQFELYQKQILEQRKADDKIFRRN